MPREQGKGRYHAKTGVKKRKGSSLETENERRKRVKALKERAEKAAIAAKEQVTVLAASVSNCDKDVLMCFDCSSD
jgi:hypothetical protein